MPLADSLGNPLIVLKNKSIWIPVEVTKVGSSFSQAWETGAQKYYQEWRKDKEFAIKFFRDIEGVYISVSLEELSREWQNKKIELPELAKLRKMFAHDTSWIIQKRTRQAIERYQADIKTRRDSLTLRNKLGIIFAQQNSLAQAEEQFRIILKREPDHAPALVNLGNIYFIFGHFEEAAAHYLKAEKQLASEPGLYLNLAILYQLWREVSPDSLYCQTQSENNLLRAFGLLSGNESKALDLLGILDEEADFGEKGDFLPSWLRQLGPNIKNFIKDGLQKHLLNKSIAGTRPKRRAVKRQFEPERCYILWWADVGRIN